MSGCGIWYVKPGLQVGKEVLDYYPVGIFSEHYREHNYILGIRYTVVSEIIRQKFGEPLIQSNTMIGFN